MDSVNKNILALRNSIQKCQIYKEYRKQRAIINSNPELAERVRDSGQIISGFRMRARRELFFRMRSSWQKNRQSFVETRK